jgi:long-chain acyl-CoA synthetase
MESLRVGAGACFRDREDIQWTRAMETADRRSDQEVTMPRTLNHLFAESVERFGDRVLLWEKKGARYEGITYAQMRGQAHCFAAGLMRLGVRKGDRIALISEGRADWVWSELGILLAGAVNVPISVRVDELAELKFRLAHSGCRLAVVSRSQLAKVRKIKNDLPELEKTIALDPPQDLHKDELTGDDLLRLGGEFLAANAREFADRWQSVGEGDYATISYTSGTTAEPKGIILSHRNYTANIEQANSLIPCPPRYVTLLILPWDHAFAHTCGIYAMMKNGAALAAVQQGKTGLETLKNVPQNIREVRPTILLSAPALARNFRKSIERGVQEKGPRVQALFAKALRLAYDYNGDGWDRGRGLRKFKKPLYLLYDQLIFSKIRRNFGGRLEYFVGGAALLDIELQRFFYAIGIPMYQGYGLTEAAPVIAANSPRQHKLGSSGRPVAHLGLRICDEQGKALPPGSQGEIAVRGENVMAGYWKNEKATREALRDGWLYTGDIGYLDRDGFLFVLGRNKSLLIANDGEKYSPEAIEETLCSRSPYIEQLLLHNNQSPYTVALLVPNKEALLRRLQELGLSCATREGQEAVLSLLQAEISAFRDNGAFAGLFPSRWLPAAVAVLGEGFSEQNRFLNSTMKMVRGRIEEFYRSRLDYLFTAEGKPIVNPQNLTIVSRWE